MTINLNSKSAEVVIGILAKECDFMYECIIKDDAPYAELEDYYWDMLACVNLMEQVNPNYSGIYGEYRDMLDECHDKLFA